MSSGLSVAYYTGVTIVLTMDIAGKWQHSLYLDRDTKYICKQLPFLLVVCM